MIDVFVGPCAVNLGGSRVVVVGGLPVDMFSSLCSAVPPAVIYMGWRDCGIWHSLSNSPQLICGLS